MRIWREQINQTYDTVTVEVKGPAGHDYAQTKVMGPRTSLLLATCTKSAPFPTLSKTTTPPSPVTPPATKNLLSGPPNCIPRTCTSPVKNWLTSSSFPFAQRVKTAIESPLGSLLSPLLRFEA